jgi:hypothetical protein
MHESDPQKKEIYDKFGEEGLKPCRPGPDIPKRKDPARVSDLPVSLIDIYKGTVKNVKITRKVYSPNGRAFINEDKILQGLFSLVYQGLAYKVLDLLHQICHKFLSFGGHSTPR